MTQAFSWIPDPARGDWLRVMEAEPFARFYSIVPRGFDAYARIFHPVPRDRPQATGTWHNVDPDVDIDPASQTDPLEYDATTWAATAQAFGTIMHPQAQFAAIAPRAYENEDPIGTDGWRYGPPQEGNLDINQLTLLSAVLADHTSTPTAGVAAIWEGWGGLTTSAGWAHFGFVETGTVQKIRSTVANFRNRWPRRTPKLGSGVLPAEVAQGPHFGLHDNTGRSYILFSAGATDFADQGWTQCAPWVGEHLHVQSPSLLWPDDHAWVMATEIDYDSTLVAGSTELIHAIVTAPGLEAAALPPNADLTAFGDRINAPDA